MTDRRRKEARTIEVGPFSVSPAKRAARKKARKKSCVPFSPPNFRGSLFCHQELALASYLDKDVIAFHEEGVLKEDGISRVIHFNSTSFTDRTSLPAEVAKRVQEREWRADWRDMLSVSLDIRLYIEQPPISERELAYRSYYMVVTNRHLRKPALNCCGYLAKLRHPATGYVKNWNPIELNWGGYAFPSVTIWPGQSRHLTAFRVNPDAGVCNMRIDSFALDKYDQKFLHQGSLELTYWIACENMPIIEAQFHFNNDDGKHIQFEQRECRVWKPDEALEPLDLLAPGLLDDLREADSLLNPPDEPPPNS